MSGIFQPGTHPDADQLSVFVEGVATAGEHERMLAHLAKCAECRKAVFLMQPHEEKPAAMATPAKGWIWRRLLPVGLPAAALACGLIAVLIYVRPRGGTPEIRQRNTSVTQTKTHLPATTVAPAINSETVARSGRSKKSFEPNVAANASGQENKASAGSHLRKSKRDQIAAKVEAPQTTAAAPSVSVPVDDAAVQSISPRSQSDLPSNGRNVTNLKQFSTGPQAPAAASQNNLAEKKVAPPLGIELANGQDATLAGVSGHITDPSGAIIAGATVTLRDPSGKTRQTTTGKDGSFRLTELPAGQYELTATANGFQTKKQPIELKPSEVAMLQPVLDVGSVSETVEVTAASPLVESAGVSGQAIEGMPSASSRVIAGPSGLPVTATVSVGKRFLSLDSAGNLFLSGNGGKKWKKINPQWAGKAVRIELMPASMTEASAGKSKNETSAEASAAAIFHLTTDAGDVWTSKDGKHWHQQ